MQPHQQRVIDEKAELDKRLEALRNFAQGEIMCTLPEEDQRLLIQQENAMDVLSSILGQRIERFNG